MILAKTMNSQKAPQLLRLRIKLFFFAFALFGYGIISLFVSDATVSRAITIPYRAIILFLSIVIIIFYRTRDSASYHNHLLFSQKDSIIFRMTLIFIFIYTLRFFYELIYNENLISQPSEYLLNWFGICLIPGTPFLYLELRQSKKYLYYSWIILFIIGLIAIPLTIQGSQSFKEIGRLAGEALNPISLGNYASALVLISLYLLSSKKISNKRLNIIFITSLLPGIVLLFLAASRGPIIATIVCCFLLLISLKREGVNIIKLIIGIIITTFAVSTASSFAVTSGSSFIDRFAMTLAGDEFSNTAYIQRPELLQISSQLIADNPIFGFGLEVPNIGYPHNLIVEAFLTTGIFGGFIFMVISIYTVVKAVHIIMDKNNSWSWLGLIFIQQFIVDMFSGCLYLSSTFWYLSFAIISIQKIKGSK